MYTAKHAKLRPLQPAFIMANSGEAVTYQELEARANRLAHLLRGLVHLAPTHRRTPHRHHKTP